MTNSVDTNGCSGPFEWGSRLTFAAVVAWFALAYPAQGQQVVDQEKAYKVKAVFLYSFGRFTTWPDATTNNWPDDRPFTVGVVGDSPIAATLDQIAQKRQLQGRPIRVERYPSTEAVLENECQMLFLSSSVEFRKSAALLNRLRGSPVLTVTELPSRVMPGCVINFVLDGDTVHFEINISEAQHKELTLDARLLRQGKNMETQGPSGAKHPPKTDITGVTE